jgi:hypothetical protein
MRRLEVMFTQRSLEIEFLNGIFSRGSEHELIHLRLKFLFGFLP